MKIKVAGTFRGRPIVLFPDGWTEGWMCPEIGDGQIPLYLAEAYLAKAIQRYDYPFTKLPTTAQGWREYREAYYLELCSSPFGYSSPGVSHAPWGMSVHGVPKLHPDDK
jgi:hypothetical protein